MKKYVSFCFLLLISSSAFCQSLDSLSKEGWQLHFHDEFNDSVLDTDTWLTWFPYTDDGSDKCAFCRTHGDENQVFLDRNVVLENGILRIIAKKEKAVWMNEHRDHTSGMIHSRPHFGQGYYEIRAKLPKGEGFWPGIWTFGQIWSEVDLMEAGMQNPKRFHISVHNGVIKKMAHKRIRVPVDLSEGFHTYAMEWDSNYIKFFFDNEEVWQLCKWSDRRGRNIKNCNNKKGNKQLQPVFPHINERLFMIVGMGIGNETTPFTSTPNDETVFPASLDLDYIRIYTRRE